MESKVVLTEETNELEIAHEPKGRVDRSIENQFPSGIVPLHTEESNQIVSAMNTHQPDEIDLAKKISAGTSPPDKHNGISYPPRTPDSTQPTISSSGLLEDQCLSIETGLETVYIEQRNGSFKPTSALNLISARECYPPTKSRCCIRSALDMAILVQKIWCCLSNFCFGILAGVAALHLIIMFSTLPLSWTDANVNSRTIELYSSTAFILPIIFYLCLIICLISLIDRYDTSQLENDDLKETFSYKMLWVVMVLYLLIFLLNALSAKYDDLFVLYPYHESIISYPTQTMVNQLMIWRWLDGSKCVLCVIGWILVSLVPSKDFLLHHLKYLKTYDMDSSIPST